MTTTIAKTVHRLEIVVEDTMVFQADLHLATQNETVRDRLIYLLEAYVRFLVGPLTPRKETTP